MSQTDRNGLTNNPAGAPTQLTWRGTWAPATEYQAYNIAYFDGSSYLCLTLHTASASFLGDLGLGYWAIFVSAGADGVDGANGSGTGDLVAANNLSDVANTSTARSNLGAAKSGANSDITSLAGLTTALSVGQGGTGTDTLSANAVLLGNGTSAVQSVAPSTSGNVLTSNGTSWESAAPAGWYGQTWQSVIGSRSFGVTYTNTSGKPIQVSVTGAQTSGVTSLVLTIDGVQVAAFTAVVTITVSGIVPAGSSYSVAQANMSLSAWAELR